MKFIIILAFSVDQLASSVDQLGKCVQFMRLS